MFRRLFTFDFRMRFFLDSTYWLPEWVLRLMPLGFKYIKADAGAAVKKAFNESIDDAIKNESDDGKERDMRHVDVLSVIVQSHQFSKNQVLEQLMLFVSAGHESTATTLWWFMLESTFPRSQDKCSHLTDYARHSVQIPVRSKAPA